jgi:ankyrin repeat protein
MRGVRVFATSLALIVGLCEVARADPNKDLSKAIEKQDRSQIEKAFQKGASPEAIASDGKPVLALAARQCQLWIVRLLVSRGASVQAQGTAAWNAASRCNCSDGIEEFLVAMGLPLPTPGTDSCGRTPLMIAARQGRIDIARSLLAGGASPNTEDADGETAMYYAVCFGQKEVAKLLVEQGHATPLEIATVAGKREVYIWRSSPLVAGTPQSTWNISGALGTEEGGLGESLPINPGMFLSDAARDPGPAPGFEVWYFAPRDSSDHLSLESGSLNCCQESLRAPITFVGLGLSNSLSLSSDPSDGPLFWATPPNQQGGFASIQAALYPGPGGTLELGGGVILRQGQNLSMQALPAVPVSVTGTIRFPDASWTLAKKGLKIRGGGLQFDETGVFLMPGTQYLREAH